MLRPRRSPFKSSLRLVSLLVLAAIGAVPLRGIDPRPEEAGRPVVRNFTPREYAAHHQVFGIGQAANGLMYLGVYAHVLEFDGRTWRRIPVSTSWIRAVVPAPQGEVYVAATEQLGVCRPAADGLPVFESLFHHLPARLKPVGPFWSAAWHDDAVFFAASRFVARWHDGRFDLHEFESSGRSTLHHAGGEFLLRRTGDGLFRWDGRGFARVDVPDELVRPTFAAFVDAGERGTLVATDEGKMFFLRGHELTPWHPPLAAAIAGRGLRNLIQMRNGLLVATTSASGVLIADREGHVLQSIREATHGIGSDVTYGIMEDRDGGLWVASYNGASRLELDNGLTLFDQLNGRGPTITSDMLRWRGRLYIGTNDAVYTLAPAADGRPAHLQLGTRHSTWTNNFTLYRDTLLATADLGVQRYFDHGRSELVATTRVPVAEIVPSSTDPSRYFVGLLQGVVTLRFDGDKPTLEGRVGEHGAESQSIYEEADGTLWLGTTQSGFVRARRRNGSSDWTDAELLAFAPGTRGLPADPGWCRVVRGPAGIPLFSTGRGAFVADAARENLLPAPQFASAGKAGLYSHPIVTADDATIYAQVGHHDALDQLELGRLVRRGDGWVWEKLAARVSQLAGYLGAYHLYHEPGANSTDGVLWVTGRDAIVRVDLATGFVNTSPPPIAHLRTVTQRGVGTWGTSAGAGEAPLRLAFSREPIEFVFAAPRFDAAAGLTYQTRLRGYDETWSEWSPRGEASFTNLSGGPFTFEVRARDADGRVGPATAFTFSVAPPWHASGPAFALYALALIGGVFGFVRWRLARAERERQRLEALVAERTTELDAANKAKSLFLANMSHELRTPLNGVIGYAQVLQRSPDIVPKDRERLRVVEASGEHLLRMINEVLDLSKIEAGKFELRPAPFDLSQLVQDISANVRLRAEEKGLAFRLHLPDTLPARVLGDAQKLRQVLENLLHNAVKFTARGAVELRVSSSDAGRGPPPATLRVEGSAPPAMFHFSISDTGVGISAADQANLFQPFQQADDGRPPEPGTGLGLAISHRIVSLMQGTISVESTRGAGSTFLVRVPLAALPSVTALADGAAKIVGHEPPRRKILIVDDLIVNRAVLADMLLPLGFEVQQAEDGATALQLAPGFQPHLAFLDLRMPGMSGQELARRLRPAGARGPKLIAMSASVLSFNRADALTAGFDDFLPKPFHENELIALLLSHLDITWIYAPPAPAATAPRPDAPLERATLAQLLEAANRGEVSRLREQLSALRQTHPRFSAELETLLHGYRMEAVRRMLEAELANP